MVCGHGSNDNSKGGSATAAAVVPATICANVCETHEYHLYRPASHCRTTECFVESIKKLSFRFDFHQNITQSYEWTPAQRLHSFYHLFFYCSRLRLLDLSPQIEKYFWR